MSSLAWLLFVLQREEQPPAWVLALPFLMFLFFIAIYVYVAFCLMKIAQKTNTENAWWAWIPILNALLALNIARKPLWWIILLFIPLVQIVIGIVVLVGICEARGKSPLLVIGMLIPLVNFVVLGYLTFSD